MNEELIITEDQRQRLQAWLDQTGELFVDVHLLHSGGSSTGYFVRSVDDLQNLISAQDWPELLITVFRRLQFPIRGVADDTLLQRALREIPDGHWFSIVRPNECYPSELFCRGGGQGHAELHQKFSDVLGESVAIGEHPFDGDTSWFDSNPEEAIILTRDRPVPAKIFASPT